LQQVFFNIILNAEQAMLAAHNKGNLLIKTEQVDHIVRMSFRDDGPGIASENLDKIFDPFFTTKPVGEGDGLGLSLSYGIIKEHRGKIYAESTLGRGATFAVELPIVSEPERAELAGTPLEEPKSVAGKRILVVDDEPAVRQLLIHALAEAGHDVEAIDNATVALDKLECERYSLILLDVQMAGINGIELYKRMEKIDHSLQRRVIFMTGDTMTPATHDLLKSVKARCISKPFDIEQLKKDVNQKLRQESVEVASPVL
jgi:CheY-like chemotaxis protein